MFGKKENLVTITLMLIYIFFQWPDSLEFQMQKLFTRALSPIFANIAIDIWDDLDEVEVRYLMAFLW